MMKVCGKCGEKKCISEFPKNKSAASGISGRCKLCAKKRRMEWLDENPEQIEKRRARGVDNYWKNRDKISAWNKAWYARQPKKGKPPKPGSSSYYASVSAAQSHDRDDKQVFTVAASDDGISLAAAISLLKIKPQLKVLALAIAGAGSGGADRHYLMETVCSTGNYDTLRTAIFWLRRHLVGTGLVLENAGYAKGYRIVFEVSA